MKFHQSIRWRLQLWHGLLLAIVLIGFGLSAWRLLQAHQFRRIDHELETRMAVVTGALRRGGGNFGRPPQDRAPQERAAPDRPGQRRPPFIERPAFGNQPFGPLELRLSERETILFEGATGHAFYYVVWLPNGREMSRSASVPADVRQPRHMPGARDIQLRGTLRESYQTVPPGFCILIGRDIGDELADSRRFAWLLVGAGMLVLLIGLAGGWWVATRAIRPIADISATAARISTGDLTQRIQTHDSSSELGQLARVLNETFDRLQTGFDQQAQFIADASHELRTPVTVLLTQTQSALTRERSPEEYRDSLAACQRAAQRMRRMIESLLVLTRLDSGENVVRREVCQLDVIARDTLELLRPLAVEQNIRLDLETVPAACLGNMEQIGQVVSNLVSNAISYNRSGGTVLVKVGAEAGTAILSIKDTGQGIAAEDLPHIFDRFYRADKSRSNPSGHIGLGLAITKSIVELHGGTINAISEPGKGSTFAVSFPEAPKQPQ